MYWGAGEDSGSLTGRTPLIQRYARENSQSELVADEQLRDAIMGNIEIIGETARNVEKHSPQLVAEHDNVPWAAVYSMRSRVSHGYWAVDLEAVRQLIDHDLPILRDQI
jgi:uncharacterized protein with HEPN domain